MTSFDQALYIEAFIQRNNLHSRSEELKTAIESYRDKLSADLRLKLQGHDLIGLLFEYLDWCKALKLADKDKQIDGYGNRLLASALDSATAFAERLFSQLELAVNGKQCIWPAEVPKDCAAC